MPGRVFRYHRPAESRRLESSGETGAALDGSENELATVQTFFGGTTEIQKEIIARGLSLWP
jgi:hypothetical protein